VDDWERRVRQQLKPNRTRDLLAVAGLYALAHELLKTAILDGVKGFFLIGFDEDGFTHDSGYAPIRDDPGGAFAGSVAWLRARDVIDGADEEALERVRSERHRVIHQSLGLIVDPDFDLDVAALFSVRSILGRVGQFFGAINVETDPAFDDVDIDVAEIRSGLFVAYDYVLDALADLLQDRTA
jgi:hypothetical protein